MVLYSALEVATKNYIKTKKPDTDYLVNKMQSPDLQNLYKHYINAKIEVMVDKAGLTTIQEMGTQRNKIAHQGEDVGMTNLSAHYSFVSSLIKKLEISLGYV
ncbi:hypothetical protein [uncultured Nostoc sp.]|uniref:hypothetical protein n=1 Tax=uncultured Nostoc sp. TaxID=340711 RepID=UPI0035CB8CCE